MKEINHTLCRLPLWGVLLVLLVSLSSCDELFNNSSEDKNSAYLMSDNVGSKVKEGQTIKVMHDNRLLFEMTYSPSLYLVVSPEYTSVAQLMYAGRVTTINDILMPVSPRWGDSAQIIVQGGIIAKVKTADMSEEMYLRIYVSSGDYNLGEMTLKCNVLDIPKKQFGAVKTATISKGSAFTVRDDSSSLNLFTLYNEYPNLRINSIFSGQSEQPQLTYCGQFDKISEVTLAGTLAETVEIKEKGGYYSVVKTIVGGTYEVRMFIDKVNADGSISIQYQMQK